MRTSLFLCTAALLLTCLLNAFIYDVRYINTSSADVPLKSFYKAEYAFLDLYGLENSGVGSEFGSARFSCQGWNIVLQWHPGPHTGDLAVDSTVFFTATNDSLIVTDTLMVIKKFHEGHLKDKEIVISINKAIDSIVELRNKKELIRQFIDSLTPSANVDDDWFAFVDAKKVEELDQIINDESLDKDETYKFITNAFRDGYIQATGTAISKVLPPVSRFTPSGDRTKKRDSVLEKLRAFFDKFWDISGGRFLLK